MAQATSANTKSFVPYIAGRTPPSGLRTDLEITEKELKVLRFITQFRDVYGCPPSVQEICTAFDYKSSMSGRKMLEQLEKKGYIKRTAGLSRFLKVLIEPDAEVGK